MIFKKILFFLFFFIWLFNFQIVFAKEVVAKFYCSTEKSEIRGKIKDFKIIDKINDSFAVNLHSLDNPQKFRLIAFLESYNRINEFKCTGEGIIVNIKFDPSDPFFDTLLEDIQVQSSSGASKKLKEEDEKREEEKRMLELIEEDIFKVKTIIDDRELYLKHFQSSKIAGLETRYVEYQSLIEKKK